MKELTRKVIEEFNEKLTKWITNNSYKAIPNPTNSYLFCGMNRELKNQFMQLSKNDQDNILLEIKIGARDIEKSLVKDNDNRGSIQAIIGDFGFSYREVARMLNLSPNAVSLWFKEDEKASNPTYAKVEKLREEILKIKMELN